MQLQKVMKTIAKTIERNCKFAYFEYRILPIFGVSGVLAALAMYEFN